MIKDLEAIKYLNDTCINFLDRTKELYCTVTFTRKRAEILRDNIVEVEQALKRLESIDNAEPSEALKDLKELHELAYGVGGWKIDEIVQSSHIKQALLKAETPKKYLKWEDLEFNHTPKMIDVKMNDNKYRLVVGYNVAGNNLAILRDNKKEYYFLECDKQFFNDLHLERVEE